ncbi:MAG: efflux RND transporter periplasmic adaptor subunit [Candidatus Hydrogenedentes bacterium]|nr:efflux RND transporter periplasmic adaptor subunit [Candidatus Hydrogenedentota bacterium]
MKYFIPLGICLFYSCIFLLCSGCNEPASGNVEDTASEPDLSVLLTPVQVVSPHRGEIASYFETTSRVEAENRVDLLAKGAGQCIEIKADVGDRVEAGQALALLERNELEAQVRQARIRTRQQKTAYEIATRSFNEGIAASVDRDNTCFSYEQAQVSLEIAELQLENQTVYAPINGIITRRVIQPGMIVSPGVPVFSIVNTNSYVLPINVPEKELARLHKGQKAYARIDAFPDHVFAAKIRRISPSIDPLSGTIKVLLDFDEIDRHLLREAAFSRVQLIMDMRKDALLLPRDAILEEEGRKYVFVVVPSGNSNLSDETKNSTFIAKRQEITTGIEQSDVIEVLDGISNNALIVIMGQHSLKPDTPVKITNIEDELVARKAMTPEEALNAAAKRKASISADPSGHTADSLPL